MSAPTALIITAETFSHLLSQYPAVVRSVYATRIKDSKRLLAALQDDDWRYDQLPAELKKRKEDASKANDGRLCLSKEELQRLMQWKITHGTYRPFLPALIRKNEARTVQEVTHAAFSTQSLERYSSVPETTLPTDLLSAIKEVSKLQGVGPATAPLICSIFDPEDVPFFEDELYKWLFPGSEKLKYTAKEYQQLFHGVRMIQKRLGVKAVEVEKVGFVVGHWGALEPSQTEGLKEVERDNEMEIHKEEDDKEREKDGQVAGGEEKESSRKRRTGARQQNGAEQQPAKRTKRTQS